MNSPENLKKLSLPKKSSLISKSVEYLRLGLMTSVLNLMSPTAQATPLAESSICQESDICEDPSGFGRSWRASFGLTNSIRPVNQEGFHYRLMGGFVAPLNQGVTYNLQTAPEANIYFKYKFSSPLFVDMQSDSLIIRPYHSESGENIYFGDNTVGLGMEYPNALVKVFGGSRNYALESVDNPYAQLGLLALWNINSNVSIGGDARYIFNSPADQAYEWNLRARINLNQDWSFDLSVLNGAQWGSGDWGGMLNLSYIFGPKPRVQTTLGSYVGHPLYSNASTPTHQTPWGLNIEVLGSPGSLPEQSEQPAPPAQDTEMEPNLEMTVAADTNATNIKGWLESCSTNCQITVPISQIGTLQEALKDGDNYVGEKTQKTVLTVDFEGNNPTEPQLAAIKELLTNRVGLATNNPAQNTDGISIANKHKITQDTQLDDLQITLTDTEKHYSQILANTGDRYPQLIKVEDYYRIKYGAEEADTVSVQNALFLEGGLYKIVLNDSDTNTDSSSAHDLQVQYLSQTAGITKTIEPFNSSDGPLFPNLENHKSAILNLVHVIQNSPEGVKISHETNAGWAGVIIIGANPPGGGKTYHLQPVLHCAVKDADYNSEQRKLVVKYGSGVSGVGAPQNCTRQPDLTITFPPSE